jgi:hypothetical protein
MNIQLGIDFADRFQSALKFNPCEFAMWPNSAGANCRVARRSLGHSAK